MSTSLDNICHILSSQKEVKYLTYFVMQDRLGVIKLKLGTTGVDKVYKFSEESACLNKLVSILSELKRLEIWNLKRMDKKK